MIRNLTTLLLCIGIMWTISCRKVNDDCNTSQYPTAPSQAWFKSYKGSEEESHGHFILSCTDGGFLQVGETGLIPNSAKILVVKTDAEGDLQWKKEFAEGGHNLGNSAMETDDAYVICGALNENSTLFKLNKTDGAVIFQKTYDNGGNDAFEHIVSTSNGWVVVGYINAQDKGNTFYTEGEAYLAFLNSEGILQAEVNINNYLSHAYRIKEYNNNLIVSGLTQNAADYGLIKMDSLGNIIWGREFGGSSFDHCFGMDVGGDGAIFLTGHTLSGTENWDTYTMKIDADGNKIWETKAGNPRGFKPKFIHDEAWGIKSTTDGGCIVVAGTGD